MSLVTIHEFAEKFPGQLTLGCSFREAALALAGKGWKVFPIRAKGKKPLTVHGLLDASSDPDIIETWAVKWPNANIGIVTGNVIVVDIDPRHGGDKSIADLEVIHGTLPETLESKTGGGGRHLYFKAEGAVVRCSQSELAPGIDIKGVGGYVVAPPSVHESGDRYLWTRRIPPVGVPKWLLQKLRKPSKPEPLSANGNGSVRTIPEGERNDRLFRIGSSLRAKGLSASAILAALLAHNAEHCVPPLGEVEVQLIAASASRYPAGALSEHPKSDSIYSAPIDTKYGQKELVPRRLPFRTAQQVASETSEQVEWISKPYVAAGSITEVDGKVKLAGKTTWTTHLCSAVLDGRPFMGEPTSKSPVVYLTEQPPSSWRLTLERAGLLGREDFHCLYFRDVRGIAWEFVSDDAINYCRQVGARLLVVDTLSQFAGIAGDSENNSGDALQAMMPLQEAAGHGLAVVILRHDRKSGGLVGESGRGSSAYSGTVDIVLSIRRPEGNTKKTLRTIHAVGRFDGIPDELVIDLTPTGYVSLGASSNVAEAEAERVIMSAAPETPEGATTLEDLIGASEVKRATAQRVVKRLCAVGTLFATGGGKRGDPFRYFLAEKVSAQTPNIGGQK